MQDGEHTAIYKEMRKSETLEVNKLALFLQSVTTAAVLGMFGFLWSMNARMAVAEERDRAKTEVVNRMQLDVNTLRLDVQDLKIRVAELQTTKDNSYNRKK